MTIMDLRAVMPSHTEINVWTLDRSGGLEEVASGTCKSLPEAVLNASIDWIDAVDADVLDINVSRDDLERAALRKEQTENELENMLGWMNIRR